MTPVLWLMRIIVYQPAGLEKKIDIERNFVSIFLNAITEPVLISKSIVNVLA